jgi:hypothetical protein
MPSIITGGSTPNLDHSRADRPSSAGPPPAQQRPTRPKGKPAGDEAAPGGWPQMSDWIARRTKERRSGGPESSRYTGSEINPHLLIASGCLLLGVYCWVFTAGCVLGCCARSSRIDVSCRTSCEVDYHSPEVGSSRAEHCARLAIHPFRKSAKNSSTLRRRLVRPSSNADLQNTSTAWRFFSSPCWW